MVFVSFHLYQLQSNSLWHLFLLKLHKVSWSHLVMIIEELFHQYFSCSWISQYSNEAECLFVQNANLLKISDITDVIRSHTYSPIITALYIINEMTVARAETDMDTVIGKICKRMAHLIRK
eukprot:891631_1